MSNALVTAPAAEPISVTDAKSHLRVVGSDDDSYITALIVAARQYAENFTRRTLITQTWDIKLNHFPCDARQLIELPFSPLQSVTSISYVDAQGVTQTWDSSLYMVDSDAVPAQIVPVYGEVYPSTRDQINAVTIRMVTGYGDAGSDVPQEIIQAMLMHIGHLYEHRESYTQAGVVTAVPMATDTLLYPYRDFRF